MHVASATIERKAWFNRRWRDENIIIFALFRALKGTAKFNEPLTRLKEL